MRDPHIWDDEPKKKAISKLRGMVETMANKPVDHMANAPSMANKPMANIESLANANPKHSKRNDLPVSLGPLGRGDGLENSSPTYKYRDAEKRRAYQREYMRKKRANG